VANTGAIAKWQIMHKISGSGSYAEFVIWGASEKSLVCKPITGSLVGGAPSGVQGQIPRQESGGYTP